MSVCAVSILSVSDCPCGSVCFCQGAEGVTALVAVCAVPPQQALCQPGPLRLPAGDGAGPEASAAEHRLGAVWQGAQGAGRHADPLLRLPGGTPLN